MTKANKNRRTQHPNNANQRPKRAQKRTLGARPKPRSSPKVAAGKCAREAAKSADAEIDRKRHELYAAIEREWTPKVQKAVLNFARKRVRMLANAGVPIEHGHAEHLVADAVSDTTLRTLTWRTGVNLKNHLLAAIRSRTAKLASRQRRFVHQRIRFEREDLDDSPQSDETPFDVLSAAQAKHRALRILRAVSRERSDALAVRMLDLYRLGIDRRSEIARELGASPREVDRGWERLKARATTISDALHGSGF